VTTYKDDILTFKEEAYNQRDSTHFYEQLLMMSLKATGVEAPTEEQKTE